MTMVDNRPEANPSGLSGKRETWIISCRLCDFEAQIPPFAGAKNLRPVAIISEGTTAWEAWCNAAGIIFRVYGSSLMFPEVRVETPAAYHKRLEVWSLDPDKTFRTDVMSSYPDAMKRTEP